MVCIRSRWEIYLARPVLEKSRRSAIAHPSFQQAVGSTAGTAGAAVSYALGQGAPLVAAIWGVFIWKEFKGAKKGVNVLLTLMFALFIAGLALIIVSGN